MHRSIRARNERTVMADHSAWDLILWIC